MLAYIFSFIDRQILALMIEPIKADLNLSDTQFSLLHGLAFSLFYAFMGLPLAYLADRFSRPKIIAVGIIFWSIATALCGLSKNFIQLFFSRMGVGVGEAALSPAAYSMFSDMFSKDKLGRAVAVYSIGSFVGGGIAFLVGGYVIGLLKDLSLIEIPVFGAVKAWQMAFILVGLPGILIGLLFVLTVRDPKRKGQSVNAEGEVEKVTIRAAFTFLKKHRKTFTCHYLGFTFYAMALYCLISWSPAFFMRKFSMTPTEAGYMLGTVLLVANTLGVFCAGWLNDWLIQKGRKDAPMITGVIGIVGLVLPLVAFTQVSEYWLAVTLLAPAMFFASFPMPISTTAMQMLAPNQLRAQISAIFLLISNLVAVGIGTTLVALVTDKIFENPLMVGTSLSIVGGIACVLSFVLLKQGCKAFADSMQREHSA
ncbi:transporter, major facilitator family protein [Acinetobacter radioresistens WC-A-157]|nr:transporter, major facilitator family protein [Acinetobacter radioresistens WC-A-157]